MFREEGPARKTQLLKLRRLRFGCVGEKNCFFLYKYKYGCVNLIMMIFTQTTVLSAYLKLMDTKY